MKQGTDLKNFLIQNRATGQTSILKQIAEQSKCHIIVANIGEEKQFNGKAISIIRFPEAGMGAPRRPVFIDNGALIKLIENYEAELQKSSEDKIKAYANLEDSQTALRNNIRELEDELLSKQKLIRVQKIEGDQYYEERNHWKRKARNRGIITLLVISVYLLRTFLF